MQASVSVNYPQLLYCQESCTLITRPTPKQKYEWVITYKCSKILGFHIPKVISRFDFPIYLTVIALLLVHYSSPEKKLSPIDTLVHQHLQDTVP